MLALKHCALVLLVVWVGVTVGAYYVFGDMIKEICNRPKGG